MRTPTHTSTTYRQAHYDRLRLGRPGSVDRSQVYLDAIDFLLRIQAHAEAASRAWSNVPASAEPN